MKIIIAGSRTVANYEEIVHAMHLSLFSPTEIVSGTATGADTFGEQYAAKMGFLCTRFKPDWSGLGKRAGFVRNVSMGNYADALVAVWDRRSRGTKHMIEYMKSLNKPVEVVYANSTR